MKSETTLKWVDGLTFDTELNGHHFFIDADEKVGGRDKGPRPKSLLLSSLGGCTGIDVVSILKKMKVTDFSLTVKVEGEMKEEFPKSFHTMTVNFFFEGDDLPINKIQKAITLSEERYCGVSDMLKKAATLKTNIYLNGDNIL